MYYSLVFMLVSSVQGRILFGRGERTADSSALSTTEWVPITTTRLSTVKASELIATTTVTTVSYTVTTAATETTVWAKGEETVSTTESVKNTTESKEIGAYDFEDIIDSEVKDYPDFDDDSEIVVTKVTASQAETSTYRSEFAKTSATNETVADKISDRLVAALERITLSVRMTLQTFVYTMAYIACGKLLFIMSREISV